MARPHHRKKHKEHVQQFKHSQDTTVEKIKSKGTKVFAVVGAVIGFAVAFFASSGSLIWMAAGLIVCGIGGYYFGLKIDNEPGK
jgi:4-hydroxybenzoate polyprenyltransferase